DRHWIAEAMSGSGLGTDKSVAILLITEILRSDRARRNEAVRASVVELHEQAGAGDAGNVPFEGRAHLISKEMREQAVECLALGPHRAPLSGRNGGRGFAQCAHVLIVRQGAVAKF